MAGKDRRDYRIVIHTDDASMFDSLPSADTGYEASMECVPTGDSWERTGTPTRHGATADASNQGGHVLDTQETEPGVFEEACGNVIPAPEQRSKIGVDLIACPGVIRDHQCTRLEDHYQRPSSPVQVGWQHGDPWTT